MSSSCKLLWAFIYAKIIAFLEFLKLNENALVGPYTSY